MVGDSLSAGSTRSRRMSPRSTTWQQEKEELRIVLPDQRVDAIATQPPYYDNVTCFDVLDFFYVCLRMAIGDPYAEHVPTELTPKPREAVPRRFCHWDCN